VRPLPQAEPGLSLPCRSNTRSSSCLLSYRNRTQRRHPSAFTRSQGVGDVRYHREQPAAPGFLTSSMPGGTNPAGDTARRDAAGVQCQCKMSQGFSQEQNRDDARRGLKSSYRSPGTAGAA